MNATTGSGSDDSTSVVEGILRALEPEDIDMLRDAFIALDTDSDGLVSATELEAMTAQCVGPERMAKLVAYVGQLFTAADQDQDGYLNLVEFMSSFADGVGVIPADVVNFCVRDVKVRLTDDNINAIQEHFRRLDVDGDGFLNLRELRDGLKESLLPILHELSEEDMMKVVMLVMETADRDKDGRLSLSEFIRSYQSDQGVLPASFLKSSDTGSSQEGEVAAQDVTEPAKQQPQQHDSVEDHQLTAAEVEVLHAAFRFMDKNNDGLVEFSDIYNAILDAMRDQPESEGQLRDLCDMLIITADRIKRGRMTISEFVFHFAREFDALPLPNSGDVRLACQQLRLMHASGELGNMLTEYEQRHSDVPMDRVQMVGVLCDLFAPSFPNWDEYTLDAVMTAIVIGTEVRYNNRLTLDDFIQTYLDGPGIVPLDIITSWEGMELADSNMRRDSITVEDLEVAKEALRRLEDKTDERGNVSTERFYETITELFPNDPLKIEAMYNYVLDNLTSGAAEGPQPELAPLPAAVTGNAVTTTAVAVGSGSARRAAEASEEQPNKRPTHSQQTRREETVIAAGAPTATTATPMTVGVATQSPTTSSRGVVPAPAAVVAANPMTSTLPKHMYERATSTPLASPDKSRGSMMSTVSKPSYLVPVYDTLDSAVDEDELRQLFDRYDTNHSGYLNREEFKKIYSAMENFGLEPSQAEIDDKFRKYSKGSDKVGFEEFSILMLQRVSM